MYCKKCKIGKTYEELGGLVPKITIESEIRPYLNALIKEGSSFLWVQHFYQEKIKEQVSKAIDLLLATDFDEEMLLLRLFIDNRAMNYPDKYRKVRPLRYLLRHTDSLASNLQYRLSKEIFIKFTHTPNCFLEQNIEKTLESLLNIQILLEMRNRLKKKYKESLSGDQKKIEKQALWLNKEIYSRVPITQRKIQIKESAYPCKKWTVPKGYLGYDVGPGSVWYFFHGETKLILYFQREFLNLISIVLSFKDRVNDFLKQKNSIESFFLFMFMTTIMFFFQIINLIFAPYRFVRTMLAENNKWTYSCIRSIDEFIFYKEHSNKFFIYMISLVIQGSIYSELLFKWVLPNVIIPMCSISLAKTALVISGILTGYNLAVFGVALTKYCYKQSQPAVIKSKKEKNIEKKHPAELSDFSELKLSSDYLPSFINLKSHTSLAVSSENVRKRKKLSKHCL